MKKTKIKQRDQETPSGANHNEKNEIRLFKLKLDASRKKCKEERMKMKLSSDKMAKREAQEKFLIKKLLRAQEEIKRLEAQQYKLVKLLEKSTENYCDVIANAKNLFPNSTNYNECQKNKLKEMILALSSIIESQGNDLLNVYSIDEFISNQN